MQDPMTLDGPLRIVAQVPLDQLAVPIYLGDNIPTSDTYRLTFYDTWSGQARPPPSLRPSLRPVSEPRRAEF